MAYEIDQEEDQQTAPQAATPSAPAAAAPGVSASPTAPSNGAAPAPNSQSRFVGFDQLLQMNRPFAEQSAQSLMGSTDAQFNQAAQQSADATKKLQGDASAGLSADARQYTGPGGTQGYYDAAQETAKKGMTQANALNGGTAGIQSLLENSGQDTDAARYNSLFVNSVAQPQLQQAKTKWEGFDQLLQKDQAQGQAAVDRSKGLQNNALSADMESEALGAQQVAANNAAIEKDLTSTMMSMNQGGRFGAYGASPAEMRKRVDAKYGTGAYDAYIGSKGGTP